MFLRRTKGLNLALQGGGALGALTWGVLDRLLEEPRLRFEAISATSAGAMNAAVFASGLAQGGREGARQSLENFWHAVSSASYPRGAHMASPTRFLIGLSRVFSPYQLNPFDINPLRRIVNDIVDFEALRSADAVRLFVAATRVRTGSLKLFRNHELTADALLASACLPTLHHAIEIDGEAYWDGGYTGNPAVSPLLYRSRCRDILVVMLQPLRREELPTSAEAIRSRLTEFQFNAAFLREMRDIMLAQREARREWLAFGRLSRRLRALNFHMVEAEDLLAKMKVEKSFNADLGFLLKLKEEGRARADAWLGENFYRIGRRSSIDMEALFG
jgi:NTE family protein